LAATLPDDGLTVHRPAAAAAASFQCSLSTRADVNIAEAFQTARPERLTAESPATRNAAIAIRLIRVPSRDFLRPLDDRQDDIQAPDFTPQPSRTRLPSRLGGGDPGGGPATGYQQQVPMLGPWRRLTRRSRRVPPCAY
jgi:hypothetical protein